MSNDPHNNQEIELYPMFCSGCGVPWQDFARFCSNCGAPMYGHSQGVIPVAVVEKPRKTCPVCGIKNTPNSRACDGCKFPIGNIDALKTIRQKTIAEQKRCRREFLTKEMIRELDEGEFLCYMAPGERANKYNVVTERRLISFKKLGGSTAEFTLERSLGFSKIVSYTEAFPRDTGFLDASMTFAVNTNKGVMNFCFSSSLGLLGMMHADEWEGGLNFFNKFQEAYDAYLRGSSVAGALLIRAEL